jgi:hypothetical protein
LISLALGIISLTTLGLALLSCLEYLVLATAVLALIGLLLGLKAAQKRHHSAAAWIGMIFSGLALIAGSITIGIGHSVI